MLSIVRLALGGEYLERAVDPHAKQVPNQSSKLLRAVLVSDGVTAGK